MKTWKLVSGILSIILFVLVSFQSCVAGLGNALSENGEVSGTAGLMVAIFMLAGGIVSIATRKSNKNGGNIALVILFGIAAITGYSNFGSYSDLAIWSTWCLINAFFAIIALFSKKNKKNDENGEEQQ
jgi:FtsH-binding integral membrane protein